MHLLAQMTDEDQARADSLKNKILDLCLAEKVSSLTALAAARCAAEGLHSIVEEQSGGEVIEIPAAAPTADTIGADTDWDHCPRCGAATVEPDGKELTTLHCSQCDWTVGITIKGWDMRENIRAAAQDLAVMVYGMKVEYLPSTWVADIEEIISRHCAAQTGGKE